MRFWAQYLKSIRMFESFEFYPLYSYDIPTLLSIVTFIKRNNVSATSFIVILSFHTLSMKLLTYFLPVPIV
jgi:hypothetical protein